uniref:Uncharacterized protein n=1 Tax=Picea glauca TaxID=3330 RepID=A0A117NIV0_PICGL|nr:hypothetical protein ABT39_MTgene369 [Picea glauca]QHR86497.1 hypothetical protein Q903MT_gene499 [Picea sitchensis]
MGLKPLFAVGSIFESARSTCASMASESIGSNAACFRPRKTQQNEVTFLATK